MRYSIMLQIVVGTTLILVVAAAFFGRLQTRPSAIQREAIAPSITAV